MIWQSVSLPPPARLKSTDLNDVDTTPVIVNGVIYALAYNGNLTALDLRSSQIMWKRSWVQ